ncbi:MAG TPA: DoxX family protein [Candidatus Paceibacterota bacterium]|jgi:DoxX.
MRNDYIKLIVRLIVGFIFIATGWAKVSDMAATAGFFGQMGLPATIAYIVSYAEVLGGLALVLGLWTELASLGLAIIILGAMWYSRSMGFFQGELPLLAIFAALLGIIAGGAGAWALGTKMGKKSSEVPMV